MNKIIIFFINIILIDDVNLQKKIYRKYEKKKVGVAGLQPTLYLHD